MRKKLITLNFISKDEKMQDHKIYQIFYNSTTRNSKDPGFRDMDNTLNLRPDWSEYWPIRNFLSKEPLNPDCYYGFFSPKFKEKTGLDSFTVQNELKNSNEDIVIFSPYFDQSAFFINIFEQCASNHPNIIECLIKSFEFLEKNIAIDTLIMSSRQTIFCNFFAAKPHIWDEWFKNCEKLFNIAEKNNCELAKLLNSPVPHATGYNPAKVFVIERMISFLISRNNSWSIRVFNPTSLPFSKAPISNYKLELIILDALKMAHIANRLPEYLESFHLIRNNILSNISINNKK